MDNLINGLTEEFENVVIPTKLGLHELENLVNTNVLKIGTIFENCTFESAQVILSKAGKALQIVIFQKILKNGEILHLETFVNSGELSPIERYKIRFDGFTEVTKSDGSVQKYAQFTPFIKKAVDTISLNLSISAQQQVEQDV